MFKTHYLANSVSSCQQEKGQRCTCWDRTFKWIPPNWTKHTTNTDSGENQNWHAVIHILVCHQQILIEFMCNINFMKFSYLFCFQVFSLLASVQWSYMLELIWKISACGLLYWLLYFPFWCSLHCWLLAGSQHPVWNFHSRWDILHVLE